MPTSNPTGPSGPTGKPGTSALASPRIPAEYNGIQYNFCKNPSCANYGVVPAAVATRGKPASYAITYAGKGFPLLKCSLCAETPPMKSNQGIAEEVARLSRYLRLTEEPSCPNSGCKNNSICISQKASYRRIGKTNAGAQRYQCKECETRFSISVPTQYQRDTSHNRNVFMYLMNRAPLSRIIAMTGMTWPMLYRRIDFIHRQCLTFASHHERRLQDMALTELFVSVDKQDLTLNWTEREDKRNVVLSALSSADNNTGYVFASHTNFDADIEREAVEADAAVIDDALLASPMRKYARLWLRADYLASAKRRSVKIGTGGTTLEQHIDASYQDATVRDDVEAFDEKTGEQKLPDYGMQVHAEYTLIAHFYVLKKMMPHVKKWRFMLDQESGIRAAVLSAFHPEVAAKTCDAFYVRIDKDMTVDEKRQQKIEAAKKFKATKKLYPIYSDEQVKLEMLKQEILRVKKIGPWEDRWVAHPLPSMTEPKKAMCWLTEHNGLTADEAAMLYGKASLHAVDVYFEKARRLVMMFERPISSSGNAGRTWNGYAPYKPSLACKMLDIFRVAHNYIDYRTVKIPDPRSSAKSIKIKETAAMRLGLATTRYDYADVLDFK